MTATGGLLAEGALVFETTGTGPYEEGGRSGREGAESERRRGYSRRGLQVGVNMVKGRGPIPSQQSDGPIEAEASSKTR